MEQISNLPKTSEPATQAFSQVGIHKVSDFKKFTEKELLKLHGVGPKVIRLLKEARVTFKEDKPKKK